MVFKFIALNVMVLICCIILVYYPGSSTNTDPNQEVKSLKSTVSALENKVHALEAKLQNIHALEAQLQNINEQLEVAAFLAGQSCSSFPIARKFSKKFLNETCDIC